MLTAANCAGFFRLLITPFLLLLVYGSNAKLVVVLIIVLAIVSDILDGFFARKFNTVSNFGIFLDVTADKVFINTLLILMSVANLIPVWVTVVMIVRDFLVMGIRAYSASEGFVLPAQVAGKIKTIILFPSTIFIILEFDFGYWLLYLATIIAIYSLLDYSSKVIHYISRV